MYEKVAGLGVAESAFAKENIERLAAAAAGKKKRR
jgi:hypothetical protein